jgi:predicted DNA-binding protein
MYKVPMHISFPQDLADELTNLSSQSVRPRTKLIFEACRQFLNNADYSVCTPITGKKQEAVREWAPMDFLSSSGTGIR